jgi:hypothetical protein
MSVGLSGRLVKYVDQGEEEERGKGHVQEIAEVRVGKCEGHRVVIGWEIYWLGVKVGDNDLGLDPSKHSEEVVQRVRAGGIKFVV